MTEHSQCPTCGASTKKYRHRLDKTLVAGLQAIYNIGGGPTSLHDLDLSRVEWVSFQRLRYFGLAEQVFVNGKRKSGEWQITALGRSFIAGQSLAPAVVWTFRGEVVEVEPRMIDVSQASPGAKRAPEWVAVAV